MTGTRTSDAKVASPTFKPLHHRATTDCVVFRYHITASGCELAKKLVQAETMADCADSMITTDYIYNKKMPTDCVEQHVPLVNHREQTGSQLAAAPAVISGEAKRLDFVSPERDDAHQSR